MDAIERTSTGAPPENSLSRDGGLVLLVSSFADRPRGARPRVRCCRRRRAFSRTAREFLGRDFRLVPLRWRRRSINPWHETIVLCDLVKVYRRERAGYRPSCRSQARVVRFARRPSDRRQRCGQHRGRSRIRVHVASDQGEATQPAPQAVVSLSVQPSECEVSSYRTPTMETRSSSSAACRADQTVLIRGSGVDLSRFVPTPEPSGRTNVTMVSRMLWDKGVGELVEAARDTPGVGGAGQRDARWVARPGEPGVDPGGRNSSDGSARASSIGSATRRISQRCGRTRRSPPSPRRTVRACPRP